MCVDKSSIINKHDLSEIYCFGPLSIANMMRSIVSMISIDLSIDITYPDLISRVAMTSSDLGHISRGFLDSDAQFPPKPYPLHHPTIKVLLESPVRRQSPRVTADCPPVKNPTSFEPCIIRLVLARVRRPLAPPTSCFSKPEVC